MQRPRSVGCVVGLRVLKMPTNGAMKARCQAIWIATAAKPHQTRQRVNCRKFALRPHFDREKGVLRQQGSVDGRLRIAPRRSNRVAQNCLARLERLAGTRPPQPLLAAGSMEQRRVGREVRYRSRGRDERGAVDIKKSDPILWCQSGCVPLGGFGADAILKPCFFGLRIARESTNDDVSRVATRDASSKGQIKPIARVARVTLLRDRRAVTRKWRESTPTLLLRELGCGCLHWSPKRVSGDWSSAGSSSSSQRL